jgi:hypothetical protein
MDRQSSFNRYSAGCECTTNIMAGQNWERVTKKKGCTYVHTNTHTQINKTHGFQNYSWWGTTEFTLCY